jgi:predicted SprT family Zn-dependent metalloprotease
LFEAEAVQLALQLMQRWGLHDWCFKINRRRRSLGMCFFGSRRIELSIIYIRNNSVEHIRQTLLHEIAHALTPNHGHDKVWLEVVEQIGGRAKVKCSDAQMPLGHWRAECPTCCKTFSRHRKPRTDDIFHCTACGEDRGLLTFERMQPAKLSTGRGRSSIDKTTPQPLTGPLIMSQFKAVPIKREQINTEPARAHQIKVEAIKRELRKKE